MTGVHESSGHCPLCDGSMESGKATVSLLLNGTVVVIKEVPAEVCGDCQEPFMTGVATDKIMAILSRFEPLSAEILVMTYPTIETTVVEAV